MVQFNCILKIYDWKLNRGSNSVVECHLPKVDVAGSNPVARSNPLGLFTRNRGNDAALPVSRDVAAKAVLERELQKPALIFARSEQGIPVKGRSEKAGFLFILLTPTGAPRARVRLLSRVAGLVRSDYVVEP